MDTPYFFIFFYIIKFLDEYMLKIIIINTLIIKYGIIKITVKLCLVTNKK